MRRFSPSPKAAKKTADLDEKLRWGLITPHQYDRAFTHIIAADGAFKQRAKMRRLQKKRKAERHRLRALFEKGEISAEELRLQIASIEKRNRKSSKRKKGVSLTSSDRLESAMGKISRAPIFKETHMSFRSPRIRGVTARLAKKSDTAMVDAITQKERFRRKPTALQGKKVR